MDFADQLYSLKLIKMDPSLSPQRLFMQSQNTVGYDSKQMMLVAATLTQPKPQMAQAPRKRLPTPSKLILVPSLTTEFATFLSQKGTTGRIKTDYWCLLLQTGDDVELTVATSNEVQERKQQALVCIGRWSSKERAEETLQQWDIDSDAAANGIQLGKRLRLGDQPDIKIYASSHVLEK